MLREIEQEFQAHRGSLRHSEWPLTMVQPEEALADFVQCRLASFGSYQDAMRTEPSHLHHSLEFAVRRRNKRDLLPIEAA